MTSDSDRLLVQQIRDGGSPSAAAWEELVHRYEGRLRAYVRRRLRDHSVSDDVVQETFIGFLNSLTNYDDNRDLQTWLFTIASHKVTDQLRKRGRRPYSKPSPCRAACGRSSAGSSKRGSTAEFRCSNSSS